jgi:allantoinase
VELSDIPMMIVQHHEADRFRRRCLDQFERLYQEGAERAKIMVVAIHSYISGQAHRIQYPEEVMEYAKATEGVLIWNGDEILDW